MFAFLWLILTAQATLLLAAAPPQQPLHIFLLAGQSNMSGRGGVINSTWDGVVPPQSEPRTTTAAAILRLSSGDAWVPAREPLHRDIDVGNTCGVGPGMAFANAVSGRVPPSAVVGLVPCAIGGTRITEWGRGTALYNRLVRRAQAAVQQSSGGVIRGLLWYQGEADTVNHEEAKLYKSRLERFFTHIREDLQLPSLPVIQVGLASGQGPHVEAVRKAQFSINIPNVKTVDAAGLSLLPDHLHLSTTAQVELGEMLADTFLQADPLSSPAIAAQTQTSNACKNLPNYGLQYLLRPFLPSYM